MRRRLLPVIEGFHSCTPVRGWLVEPESSLQPCQVKGEPLGAYLTAFSMCNVIDTLYCSAIFRPIFRMWRSINQIVGSGFVYSIVAAGGCVGMLVCFGLRPEVALVNFPEGSAGSNFVDLMVMNTLYWWIHTGY